MSDFKIRGILPPLVTPLTPNQELDEGALRDSVDRQVNAGVDGLFVMGSTGEVAYFTDERRKQIADIVINQANGRVPVLVGCIDTSADRVIEQTKWAQDAGAAAIVATSPIYAINSPAEVADHFRRIKEHVSVPLVAYDVPVRTHCKLTGPMLVQLGSEGVLAAVKDSSGDDVGFRRLVLANRAAGSPLTLFTGHEVVCDGALLGGADGIVPGLANVDPDGYVAMWKAAQAGDWASVRDIQDRLVGLMEIAFQAPGRSGDAAGVGGFKTAMTYLGYLKSSTMAAPVDVLDEQQIAAVHAVVDTWKAAK